jgi:hypothetical protein
MQFHSTPSKQNSAALWIYFVVTFAWSWSFWRLAILTHPVLDIVAGFGPMIAAYGVTEWQSGQVGIRALLKRGIQWRVKWRWFIVIWTLPALIYLVALGLHRLLGGALPNSPATGRWGLAIVNFFLVMLVGGPLGEEFGWRGYALPALQRRFSAFWSSVILGIIWACWHLPLFFISGTGQHQLPFGLFLLNTIALSILFTWVYNNTSGSILMSILLHTAVNGWEWVIPIYPSAVNSLRPYAIVAILLTITTAMITLFFGARTLTGQNNRATSNQ